MGTKLYKNKKEGKLCGVCAGIADFLNVDVTIVRLAWVLFTLVGGCGIIVYIIAALIMPEFDGIVDM